MGQRLEPTPGSLAEGMSNSEWHYPHRLRYPGRGPRPAAFRLVRPNIGAPTTSPLFGFPPLSPSFYTRRCQLRVRW